MWLGELARSWMVVDVSGQVEEAMVWYGMVWYMSSEMGVWCFRGGVFA